MTSKGISQILCVSKVRGNCSHWWIPLSREVLHYSTFCDASCHGSSWWSVEKKILMRTNSWIFQVLSFPSLLAMSLPPKRGVWRVADRAKGKSRGNLKGGKISPALEPDFSRNCIEGQSKKLKMQKCALSEHIVNVLKYVNWLNIAKDTTDPGVYCFERFAHFAYFGYSTRSWFS